MRRIALFIAILWGSSLFAQSITITGTVLDPTGIPYQNGTGRAQLVPTNVGWTTNNGFPVNQTIWLINNMDGFGHFSIQVPSTLSYDQQASNPQYQFSFCSVSYVNIGNICFTMTPLTLTTSQDISVQIKAQSAPLPQPNSAIIAVNGVSVVNPNFGNSPCITWSVAVSLIQASFNPTCGGGGGGGGGSSVSVNSVGVATPNFLNSAVFQFVLSGSNVTGVPIAPGVEGSIIVNHANAFGSVSGLFLDSGASPTTLTDSYLLNQTGNTCFAGPSPYIDITCPQYGGRAVPSNSIPNTTATINATSSTATLASAIALKNGDGFTIVGAGPTQPMSTPGAPTVTPSLNAGIQGAGRDVAAPAGATAYSYCVVARDQNGGQTACSATGSTSTGNPMAPSPIAISTLTRSATTVSVVTSAPHGLAVGALVYVTQTSDASFTCYCFVASAVDNTHFTYTQPLNTTVPGTTLTATGGTVQWWPSNKVSWSAVTGATQYYIYGRTGGSLTFLGISRPGDLFWEDYGQTAAPRWLGASNTPPVSAVNDYLVTTVCAGAGTTTLTLCGTATNSVTSAFATFDDSPAFSAAVATALSTGGTVHFPASPSGTSYYLGSATNVGGDGITIMQSAQIIADETIYIPLAYTWHTNLGGTNCNVQQFSWNCGQPFTSRAAFPGIYSANTFGSAGSSKIEDVSFIAPNNGLSVILGGFNNTLRGDTFRVGSGGGGDTTGIAVIGYGTSQLDTENTLFIVSGPNTAGTAIVPALFMRNDTGGNPSSSVMCHRCFFNNRAIGTDSFPGIGGTPTEFIVESYANGLQAPLFATARPNGENIYINGFAPDTETQPMVANWSTGSVSLHMENVLALSVESASNQVPGLVTGNALAQIIAFNNSSPVGQNFNAFVSTRGQTQMGEPLAFPAGNPAFWSMQIPGSPACVVSAGGSVPTGLGAWIYVVSAVDVVGGKSATSFPVSCTPTPGNQTITITWTAPFGAQKYFVYRGRAGTGLAGVIGCEPTGATTTCVDTASFQDGANSAPTVGNAGASGINASTVWAQTLTLISALNGNPNSFTDSISTTILTGNRIQLMPDSNGIVCVTGLVNCNFFTDTGTANTYSFCPSTSLTAYLPGMQFTFQVANANTGPSTLNVCSVGAVPIKKNGGTGVSVGSDLATNDYKAGQIACVEYDGTNFQNQCQLGNASGGGGLGTTGSPVSPNMTCFSSPTTITNCNLSGDVSTAGSSVTTVNKIQGVPVNTSGVVPGQILNVIAGPQYVNQYPGVNYNNQGTTYSIACPGDRLGKVDFTGSSATTFTLPQVVAGTCTGFGASYLVSNHGTATLTLAATSSTFDGGIAGATGVPILPGAARFVQTDSSNYHTDLIQEGYGGAVIKATSYTAVGGDDNSLVIMNCTSACTFTLPSSPPLTGESTTHWNVRVMTIGTTNALISLNGLNFNGSASVPVLQKFVELDFNTDGIGYYGSAPIVCSTNMTCTPASNGLSLSSTGGGGGGPTIQTSGVANSTQTTLNFQGTGNGTSGANNITPSNPSGGIEQFTITNIQGTDAKLASAGTISSTAGQPACSDANAGVTTTGCVTAFSALTDGATVTWASTVPNDNKTLTFTVHGGSRTLNVSGLINGGNYVLSLIQDATGGENLVLGTGCTWFVNGPLTTTLTLSNVATGRNVLAFIYDGTNCLATLGLYK